MLQRHQRPSLEQILSSTRQRLQNDLNALNALDFRNLSLTSTAEQLLEMYSNITHPITCLEVIKEKFQDTKHPHSLQLQMILDKAQMFYIESVTHDLNKLKEQQRIMTITIDDIKDYITQANWKHGYDRDSILNQSQEIGDNIDLMKFFQGVRNYQNCEEIMHKQCIQKLKHFANSTQNQLTLRKGFLTARLAQFTNNYQKSNYLCFFTSAKKKQQTYHKLNNIAKIFKNKERVALSAIKKSSESKSDQQKIQQMLFSLCDRYWHKSILQSFRKLKKQHLKISKFITVTKSIIDMKTVQRYNYFFNKLVNKSKQNILNLGIASYKFKQTLKKIAVKQLQISLGLPLITITSILDNCYHQTMKDVLSLIKNEAEDRKPVALPISSKLKGKILLSLDKHESKPIDLRKTFLNWYLKGHEQKYAKMIYNIWLNGNTSKFSFFMRIKNLVNESKKMKIKPQMKMFLLVLMQKLNGYYNHSQKHFINKWYLRHRHCKHLQSIAKSLSHLEKNMNKQVERSAIEKIKETCYIKKLVSKYLSKRITNLVKNIKIGFDTWKTIPNIRVNKGRLQLLKIMRNKLLVNDEGFRQTFAAFKGNKIEGRSKKVKFFTKMFSKDMVYLSIFLNNWRTNVRTQKQNKIFKNREQNTQKMMAIKAINEQLKRKNRKDLRDSVIKFGLTARFLSQRKKFTLKVFTNFINNTQKQNLANSFNSFLQDLRDGRIKKQNLVQNLVKANRIKQQQVLSILNMNSFNKREQEKRDKVREIFGVTEKNMKKCTDLLFQNDTVFKVLQKMIINYHNNTGILLKSLINLPLRINWKKKSNVLDLHSKLSLLVNRDKASVLGKFKDNHYKGQYQKKKMLNVMTFRYVDCTKNYFKIYLNEVRQVKMREKNLAITRNFDSLLDISINNFEVLFQGEKIWVKKMEYLKKMNMKIKDRMRQAMKMWHSGAKTMSYYNQLNNQKKIRLLGFVSEILKKANHTETKNAVQMFRKNSNVTKIQTKFLNRLCDSQAGKVIKAMMIWKNLPVPKNKQLIAKASKFEGGLHHFGMKILRHSFSQFKDEHYLGNDRKKMAIRRLVAKSCSGIDKYFSIWKKNNEMITLFSKCHKLEYFAKVIQNIKIQEFKILLQERKSQKLEASFMKMGKWLDNKRFIAFTRWRKQSKKIGESDLKKRKALKDLTNVEQKFHQKKVLETVKKIKTQSFLRKVIVSHFVQRKKINTYLCLRSIAQLPDWRVRERQKIKKQNLLSAITRISSAELKQKNAVFSAFREDKYQGNFKKYKSCESYLKDRISQVNKILALWQNMTREDKRMRRMKMAQLFFQSSHQMVRASMSHFLENSRETQIKKNAFNRLFKAIQIKSKGYLVLWQNKTKQIKMNEKLQNTSKKNILQKINKILSSSSNERVKDTVKLFHRNFKVTKVQRRFIEKLLQTKSGKVAQAFYIWKDLPNQNMMQKYKKGQKFFFKLENMIKNKLKQAHSQFTENCEEGSSIKKQSVLKLLDITSNGVRRYYNRWDNLAKRGKTLQQVTHLINSMETIHQNLNNTFMIIFSDQRSIKIKTWAIERLIQSSTQNTSRYFNIWRQYNRQTKIAQELMSQKKTDALKIFTHVLGGSQNSQAKQIVLKFKKNLHITQISRNFLNRLLRTKSGKVIQLFEIWKNLPSAKLAAKKKKAIKFESNLHKISQKLMKKGFDPFKNQSYQARNRKRLCIERLIRASMGQEKKKFILWRQIVKEQKMLNHTHLFDSLFQKMQNNLSDNIALMVRDSGKQISQKKNLCRKLINNSNFVQHHAFLVWRQALLTDNVKIQKQEGCVKVSLLNFINLQKKDQTKKVLQAILKFQQINNLKKNEKINAIKDNKNRKIIQFHEKLSKFSNDRVSIFIKQLARQNLEVHLIHKNKSIENSFETLNALLADNCRVFMRSNRETVIIEKALNRLFGNISLSLSKVFNIWKENKNILLMQNAMSNEKKKNVLNIINKLLLNQEKSMVPVAVKKFEKNYKTTKLMKEILVKICQCKAGKVPLAFMIWKALPNPGAKKMKQKASKFESGLARLHFKKLKSTYEKFKSQQYDGNVKKKYAANKLILVTMSDSNRIFNKWRKTSHEGKITDKMKSLNQLFEISTNIVRQNSCIFDHPSYENDLKINLVKKLTKNINCNLSEILNIWKFNVKDNQCSNMERALTKYAPQKVYTQNLKYCFDKIKHRAEMEILRTYINSLWKWKMSNVEANYYAKFIKVFKESEELLILSNVFNRKQYEHLHNGFRSIAMEGAERQRRKYQITQKYLTRKLSNYFQRFKLNACFEEISTWRNIYKETIKGKKLSELVQRFARCQLKNVFDTLSQNCRYQKNTQNLTDVLQGLTNGFIKTGIRQIRETGYRRFLERISSSFQNSKLTKLQEGFDTIKLTSYVKVLGEKMEKVRDKQLRKIGFDKVNNRANRASRYRMAIKFLSYVQEQKIRVYSQTAIKSFKKLVEKAHCLRNISNMLSKKEKDNLSSIFNSDRQAKDRQVLLQRFMRGIKIKKILDSQDKKLMKKTLEQLKKKQNKWMVESVKRFVVRSHIKSSMAVSLWRLRNYEKQQGN